jgi:hypothetical protein
MAIVETNEMLKLVPLLWRPCVVDQPLEIDPATVAWILAKGLPDSMVTGIQLLPWPIPVPE